MLVRETDKQQAWSVIGWMAIQTAKNRRQTLFERLMAGLRPASQWRRVWARLARMLLRDFWAKMHGSGNDGF